MPTGATCIVTCTAAHISVFCFKYISYLLGEDKTEDEQVNTGLSAYSMRAVGDKASMMKDSWICV